MGESLAIEEATDSEVFEAYVEHFLAPTLEEGKVVLDGLGAHTTEKVRGLVEARGAQLLVLPSYSPDLNPIAFPISPSTTTWVSNTGSLPSTSA